ncbi:MAG TPA: ATP-binding protein [Myxococcaceae bacterium]|nr:ATP-binding protein [Myxococcaceae bacterium]
MLAEGRPWSEDLFESLSDGDHAVQFYEDDELLVDAVARFAAAGLVAEEPVLIVATEEHRVAFADRLRRNGVEADSALASGLLTLLDAKETLARFMVGTEPEWNRFRATFGSLLEQCRAARPTARVRVFGEMVDLLWRAGNRAAAIGLEELWNELARQQSFTLLCAYSMGNFYRPGDGERLDAVCGRHSHIVPAADDGALVARSLQAELEQRKQLEGVLRRELRRRALADGLMKENSAREAQRFRLLVESVKDYAIFMLDVDGRVSSWNVGAERIKGYRAEEILGQHFSRFYPPEDSSKCKMKLEVAAREGRFEDEGWRLRKDGTRFWAHVVISRMLDGDGRLVGFAKVTRDLTHPRLLERALKEHQDMQQLREQLMAIVGHDLRAPLSSIAVGAATMLKRGMLSAADAKAAARIARSAGRMSKMISQLLDVTRARLGGGISVVASPVDLREVCSEVIAEVEGAHPDRTVRFEAKGNTRGAWDRERLAQVVGNLIGNAIQHGKPNADIEVNLDDEGDSVALRVHNQGPPIPEQLLPVLFDPFRGRSPHSAARGDGLGLGLYICREMIHAHGGTISVLSREREGTTFAVRLPRQRS